MSPAEANLTLYPFPVMKLPDPEAPVWIYSQTLVAVR